MRYPKNDLAQIIVAYCAAYGVEDVIISPGSRNAPLTIGFTNHPAIKTYSIADERCAGFFALGIAQQKKKPVAVVCTSGSAVLNYYPAVAEAFYSDIPLIVISADRPKYLIDIGDGQTIRQENVFEKHSLFNANMVSHEDYTKANTALVAEALQTAIDQNGPVHINVPFDEPLYETVKKLSFDTSPIKEVKEENSNFDLAEFAAVWNSSVRKMILIGTNFPNSELQQLVHTLSGDESVIIFTETTSNLHHQSFINAIDKVIMPLEDDDFEELKPELLLTFGGMVVSKKIKKLLRKFPPEHHWHVDPKRALNTYFCLKKHFGTTPVNFLKKLIPLSKALDSTYQNEWAKLKKKRNEKHRHFLGKTGFSDLQVFEIVLNTIPKNAQLQLANSSIVRYTQLFDLDATLKVFCNRGTSGIDGSTSTAIGASLPVKERTVFITGDISFFYDSNALWNNFIRDDFRIILINNSGGGIFRFIPGPQSTNVLDYFESPHELNASHLCTMYGFDYESAVNRADLIDKLKDLYEDGEKPKLLEIFTPREENDKVLKHYFQYLK